ncbi:MAG TPA: hypothetical protein VIL48_10405 [Acidimicrobiales bacterium]
MEEGSLWGMIDAQPVVFPVPVHELNTALIEFVVPVEAARRLLPGDAFELVETEPGLAQVNVAALDYRRGAWGPAAAVETMLTARPVGAPPSATGIFLCDGPISQRFASEVASRAMGTSKRLETVEVDTTDADVRFRVSCGDERALTLRLPRVSGARERHRLDIAGYSCLDGEPYVTRLEIDMPAAAVDPADVDLSIGTGWFADTLRSLGLPRKPDRCWWGEGLTAVYHRPARLTAAARAGVTGRGGDAQGDTRGDARETGEAEGTEPLSGGAGPASG